ncbi:MAG: serine/threonine-protein phosphatase [Planctomycetaceae bacterium]|jgi:phosphoserine phosphatase RsbU/P|nr:serine/threonine-protein phosphatase [Planctomycetaceae bacterium]
MNILVGWETSPEIETLELMLNIGGHEATICSEVDQFDLTLKETDWDVVLLSLSFPTLEESIETFERTKGAIAGIPIVGAAKSDDITHLIQFVSQGLHSHVIRDTDGNFIMLLLSMLEAAYENVRALRAQVVAERLSDEVNSVRKLQESVIPDDLPETNGYKVVGRYEPSEIRVDGQNMVVMAGGDYYDSFALDDARLVMLVGDASGHGVKACMSIMTMHTLIRMIRNNRYANTADFVNAVNDRLCKSDIVQDEGGFITIIYCILDTESNLIEWTCAGHPLPLLQNLETNEVAILGHEDQIGLPLAIMEKWDYECISATIPLNSRLLIYTDGLEEAFPPSGDALVDQFGVEGIIGAMRDSKDLSLPKALDLIFQRSSDITEGTGRHDDTSVMMIERR